MNSPIEPFWNICRFRLGPQDLPASNTLFTGTLLLYVLISSIIGGFELSPERALLSASVEVALMLGMLRMMLWVRDLWPRFQQTATALLGTGTLFGFVAVPLMWWQFQYAEPADAFVPSLLIFILFIWSVAVVGHILRHALNTPFYVGVAVSLLYTYVSITILRAIFVTGS
jgi:hypothetical protein